MPTVPSVSSGRKMQYNIENFCRQARRRRRVYRIYVSRRQRRLTAKRPVICCRFLPDEALDCHLSNFSGPGKPKTGKNMAKHLAMTECICHNQVQHYFLQTPRKTSLLHNRDRSDGSFLPFDLDVAVTAHTGAGRHQFADNNILFQTQ